MPDPLRGERILPADFIPVAEEMGLIGAVGQWVLDESTRVLAGWHAAATRDPPLALAVNVSARQFLQPDLLQQVECSLRRHGVAPECVRLEITESVLIDEGGVAIETLHALRGLGVQLHLDDFGTGYSSLAYLARFPIDAVKIDRSFVHGMECGPRRARFVAGIAAFARSLGVGVVAEGVELPAQPRVLRELGCQYAQGYLFSRPLCAGAAARLLARDPAWIYA
ncbi:MAG: EAL domain-containing protein [Gemmatimonadetes bacterium]|nr:EAL domain-containing protein [Gemmatimonadota bacterium]